MLLFLSLIITSCGGGGPSSPLPLLYETLAQLQRSQRDSEFQVCTSPELSPDYYALLD